MAKRWHYIGDINIEYGGTYIQESGYLDHAYYVDTVPCSDCGGPNNLFWIEKGSVYLGNPSHVARALECMGHEKGDKVSLIETAYAVFRYMGGDCDIRRIIQIGKGDADSYYRDYGFRGFAYPEVDEYLRGNVSLKRYVRREWLNGE